MTCDQVKRLVEKLADGEATPNERSEAEAHLDGCESCRSHYQFVRALESASAKIDWPEPPEAYWQHLPSRVRARIERESEPRSFWQMLFLPAVLRFGAVAATLTVVVAVGFAVLRDDPSQLEPSVAQAPSAGKQQLDEKLEVVEERAAESEHEAAVDTARPPEAGVASVPSEQGFRARAQRAAPERAQAVLPAPAASPGAPPAEPAPQRFKDEFAEGEPAWEVAGLEGAVVEPASDPEAQEDRLRSLAATSERAGEARSARETNATRDEAVDARLASPTLARALAVDRCARWRMYLERNGDDGSESLEARYQVAVCSLRECEVKPSDGRRETALRDADRFLALESESERAAGVRRRAAELRR